MATIRHTIRIASSRRELVAIDGFTLEEGTLTFLFGESGIGKSLIAKALYGILGEEELDVRIDGRQYAEYLALPETRARRASSFFVFQEPSSHLNPLMTLEAQLAEGSLAGGPPTLEIARRLWEPGQEAELASLLTVYPKPHRPSGGEKQRMLIAMALKQLEKLKPGQPNLFVFDEPTGSLDNDYRDRFLSLLFEEHRKRPFTCLLVTHDYSMIGRILRAHASRLKLVRMRELLLSAGRLAVREFHPETYTGWLTGLRPAPAGEFAQAGPLLTVEGRLTVHGLPLTISRSPEGGENVPLQVRPGRMTYLKGPSGEGKTSFAKAVMGLTPSQGLRCTLKGIRLTDTTPSSVWRDRCWGTLITMIFQHADEALNANATVAQTLEALPLRGAAARIPALIAEFYGLADPGPFLRSMVGTLSGGQKQRLNLLRGLLLETEVIILDEPLNALDFESGTRVIDLLKQRLRQGKGILVISHNEEIFDALVDEADVYYLRKET
jgi:ABC-type glutathione transport system ATPase component